MFLIFSATQASQPRPGTTRSTRWRVSPSSSKSRSDPRSSCRSIRSPWVALAAQGERLFISSLGADSEDRLGAESRSLLSQQTYLACILHEIGERGGGARRSLKATGVFATTWRERSQRLPGRMLADDSASAQAPGAHR